MGSIRETFDVVVVGAGNAALCAALSARENGARVVVLEKASRPEQGGNCPFTGGGFRFVHNGLEDIHGLVPDLTDEDVARVTIEAYTADDFRRNLLAVTQGETDPELMGVLISHSRPTMEWMRAKGVSWELPPGNRPSGGAPSAIPSGVGLSARGAGPGLVQMLTTAARRNGIDILYETRMLRLLQDGRGRVCGVVAQDSGGVHEVRSGGVVLACGGFEANPQMRAGYLGAGWERARVRGSKHNTGDGHRAAMEMGARPAGQWTGSHATPVDANAPAVGELESTDRMPRRSYPLGITANLAGRRFFDEGETFAEQTFVKVGRLILEQERGIAFQIFDGKAVHLLEPRYGMSEPARADTIQELAGKLGIDAVALAATVDSYNVVAHAGSYDLNRLDGKSANDIDPPKSNWAIKIDVPPFVAFTVTGAITYTYGGLKINKRAQVVSTEGKPISGLFAAGELVGGIFYHDSLRAAGLMHGAVFGRLAGAHSVASV